LCYEKALLDSWTGYLINQQIREMPLADVNILAAK